MCDAGKIIFVLTTCVFVKFCNGRTDDGMTPVGVVGFSSGILMIAPGGVRLVVISLRPLSV